MTAILRWRADLTLGNCGGGLTYKLQLGGKILEGKMTILVCLLALSKALELHLFKLCHNEY